MKTNKKALKIIALIIIVVAVVPYPAGFIIDVQYWPKHDTFVESKQAEQRFLEKLEEIDAILEPYGLHTEPYTKSIYELSADFSSHIYLNDGGTMTIGMTWREREIDYGISLTSANYPTPEECIHDLDAYPYVYEIASCLSYNRMPRQKFYRMAQKIQTNVIGYLQQGESFLHDYTFFRYIVLTRASVDYGIEQIGDAYRATAFFFIMM